MCAAKKVQVVPQKHALVGVGREVRYVFSPLALTAHRPLSITYSTSSIDFVGAIKG